MPLDQLPVPEDAPLRLAEAAKIAFPDGSISASGLRREALKGRLTIERVAGNHDLQNYCNEQTWFGARCR